MEFTEGPNKISLEGLKELASRYERIVPKALQRLEEVRLEEIPKALAQRKKDGDAFLEKSEVTALVEWKLKHGTYRPNLSKLVASNSAEAIQSTTKDAFAVYTTSSSDPTKALTTLTKLKGIGPATASLLLSCFDQENVPFFSDELFRYMHFENARNKGWDRKITYTMKEYKEFFARVQGLRDRLVKEEGSERISVLDMEKAAFTISKESVHISPKKEEKEEGSGGGGGGADTALKPPSPKRRKKAPGKHDLDPAPDGSPVGLRRAKRLKGSPT
ncbi:MAG: hypothetical protein Q9217_002014 [Psora testacea]